MPTVENSFTSERPTSRRRNDALKSFFIIHHKIITFITNMKFVSITYTRKAQYSDPMAWLHRVRAYIGLLEALAQKDTVISIDRINYTGDITVNNVRHIFPDTGGS